MCIFQEKREWISKIKSHICPRIAQKLEERKKKVVEFDTIVTNKLVYKVSNISGTFVVNANERICTCHKWEMARIPCVHVCASLIQNRKNSYQFVDDYYLLESYKRAYQGVIMPIPDKNV